MMRKGRFDELWYVGLPNKDELKKIVEIHINKTGRDLSNYKVNKIINYMDRFTGAEVETCIKQSMYNAFFDDREYTTEDIIDAAKGIVPLAETRKEEIDALESWARHRARFATKQMIEEKDIVTVVDNRRIMVNPGKGVVN
jgi:SpoVK/Ycf46/Vps4 family AAA+-type ATPase